MKRMIATLVLVMALTGCTIITTPDGGVNTVGTEATIYAPQINGQPFGYSANVQCGALLRLDFNPGRDQYGNATGFSSSRYTIETVTAHCDLKDDADTIFDIGDNVLVWFPGYTAPQEAISGLPLPLYPLVGYPWDSCQPNVIPAMGSQAATITATARASWIEVEFVLPEQDGSYRLDLPGQSWTSENVINIRIDSSGSYTVEHSGGKLFEFDVPVDWFFIEGSWRINVGPSNVCE